MTTAPPHPRISATAWRNAVFAVFTLNGLGAAAWISRMPGVRDDLDVSLSQVGALLFSLSAGAVIGLLLSGHLVHWLGGRRTILLFLGGSGLALALIGVGSSVLSSIPVAVAGFALYGFASGITDVAMNVEGAGVERAITRNIMPWFHASWSLGTVAGAGLGAAAAGLGVSPAIHFAVMGAILVVATIVIVRWIPRETVVEEESSAPKPSFRDRMAIWLEPRTLLIGVLVLGMAFTEGSANDWLALGMVDDRGLGEGQAALVFGVFTVAMTLGRIGGVPLLDRFGRVAVLRAAAIAAAVGLAIVILVPVVPIAIAGVVLWGLGASLGFPVGMSAAADDPARAAARVSAVATVGYCAFLVGPPVLGLLGDLIGTLNSLWVVLALIVIATLAIPAAREQHPGAVTTTTESPGSTPPAP